ncbi:heavy metal transporter [Algibacter amylolyticus]|uniref:Heavy metal transporter n=1 Tax=Algibacter amylolyticus TaxID=1608400 RepID=A0A5M7BD69_9FLAO|nr:heavy metal-associated domain-containing protein [Algibacter amylolyticus]KAA5826288.1 heavy metal transporter [Algibacter amylolyticus]MBB5268491.1 cation transport ATPase [Algibacter amylolyticus]TSJ80326.1 heavy metal transporter [Algibacter amylolyticus]
MKHTYTVTGMTCNGCRTSVESKLNAIDGVTKASVDLETTEAVIEMNKHIALKKIQNALPEKYTILEKKASNVFNTASTQVEAEKSELKQLFPLFLIFGYIIVASVLLNYKPWDASGFMLDFMGLFYIVFSFFKLLDLKGFPESFKMYDPLAKAIPAYGWVYPFIELGLGVMFLMRIEILFALIITLVVLGITTIGVTKTLLDKKSIQCACLGTALKLPMTKATFIENSIMIVMAVIMLLSN